MVVSHTLSGNLWETIRRLIRYHKKRELNRFPQMNKPHIYNVRWWQLASQSKVWWIERSIQKTEWSQSIRWNLCKYPLTCQLMSKRNVKCFDLLWLCFRLFILIRDFVYDLDWLPEFALCSLLDFDYWYFDPALTTELAFLLLFEIGLFLAWSRIVSTLNKPPAHGFVLKICQSLLLHHVPMSESGLNHQTWQILLNQKVFLWSKNLIISALKTVHDVQSRFLLL